jgi:hypothetical protein
MTKLLEQAVKWLRQLPDDMQDTAARALMAQLAEEPEPGELDAIAEGRAAFARGEFSTLEEWRNEMGFGTH